MNNRDEAVRSVPLDWADLFGGETILHHVIKGRRVKFVLREMDVDTDREFQRRSVETRLRKGRAVPTDDSLTTDVWLFDRLCKAVEWGDGDSLAPLTDFSSIPPDIKRSVVFHYHARNQVDIVEEK